jgi:hypothetical protein
MGDLVFLMGVLMALAAGGLTMTLIIVKAAETYRLVNKDRAVYIFKAGLALGIWGVLSLGLMFLMFIYLYSAPHRAPHAPTPWSWLAVFISLIVGYGLVGWVLVRWMMKRE